MLRSARADVGIALMTVALVSCSDVAKGPSSVAGPRASAPSLAATATDSSGTVVTGLMWTKSVSQQTVTKVIGPSGGSLSIPNGIKVTVPSGAVASSVTFSVTRLGGNIVAYDFQPHGMLFAAPLTIQQPTLGTNLFKWDPTTNIQGAYFPLVNTLDQSAGTALVTEFEPTLVSADKAWITFQVRHFSGYMVSMGRQ